MSDCTCHAAITGVHAELCPRRNAVCPECTGHSGQHAFGCHLGFEALKAHFPPEDAAWMTPDGLREMIRSLVTYEGGQRPLAKRLGVSEPYLSDVLHKRREPGGKMLKALGCRRVVIYEVIE